MVTRMADSLPGIYCSGKINTQLKEILDSYCEMQVGVTNWCSGKSHSKMRSEDQRNLMCPISSPSFNSWIIKINWFSTTSFCRCHFQHVKPFVGQ